MASHSVTVVTSVRGGGVDALNEGIVVTQAFLISVDSDNIHCACSRGRRTRTVAYVCSFYYTEAVEFYSLNQSKLRCSRNI
jgi:hypothetical protein